MLIANDRFIASLGFRSADDIEALNVLDLTVKLDKAALRHFLYQGLKTNPHDPRPPRLPVTLKKADGSTVEAELCAYHTRLDGEDVVEIILITPEDRQPLNRIRNLPWKLYLCFLCLALLVILPNVLLPRLNVNNAPSTFLPPDAPSVKLNKAVRATFPGDEVVVLLFEGVALFSDGFIDAYDDLRAALEQHPSIEEVVAITRQDHISGSADGFLVEPLINRAELDATHPRDRLANASSDRFARGSMVARDGSAVAMVIIPKALESSILNLQLEEDILRLVREQRLEGYVSAMAGEITTDVAQMRVVLRDNMIFIPATVVVGLLLTWLLFHRVLAVIITGIVTGAVVNTTIAFYVLFQQPFNTISSIIPALLSALTIASLIHFYNALHYASKRGLNGKDRVNSALKEIRKPALFSALTTMFGLASLGLSPIPPVAMFGLTSAAGVLLIYVIVIHLLPPIFMHFDTRDWPDRKTGLVLMDKLVRTLFRIGARHPVKVVATSLLALLAATPLLTRINVETNLLEFFHDDHPLRVATAHIEDKLIGTMPMEIVFTSAAGNELIAPETLRYFRDLQTWMEAQASVDKTLSIADFVEEMHWGFNEENPAMRAIPAQADLISQYLFVYDGEDIFDFIDPDYQTARISMNLNVHGANEISALMSAVRERLQNQPPADMTWDISGAARLFADQEDLLIEGQQKSLTGALVLIFLLMLLIWRSLRDAVLCMIPNLSPILLIFIVMGAFSISLDLATAMIASVAVGIAVDDTIFLYHGFISRVKQGNSPALALARTYKQAGRAVMTTTAVLCTQFLLLTGSLFVPMGHFGLLTATGLITALLFDLLLLPALLMLVFNRKSRRPQPV